MNWPLALSFLAILARATSAWQYVSSDGLPSEALSASCKAALVADLACPPQVASFFERVPVSLGALEEACTTACRTSLADYEASLKSACGEDDLVEYEADSDPVHASIIATDMYYHFSRTCIKDGDRWCNIWAFENAQGTTASLTGTSTPTVTASSSIDMCDNCIIKPFQLLAGTSYSNGFDYQAEYSTLTESCSKTGFPLSTTATGLPSTTASPTPACSGTEYTIQAGDTCQSISEAHDVATSWMLYDNNLQAFCSGFPTAGEKICIVNQCKTYKIKAGDTCQSIAVASKISMVQLYTWNPVLGQACNRISLSVGHTVCLEPHGDADYKPITHITSTPTPKPTTAPAPANIATGTNQNCAQFYSVEVGDYCNQIILKFSISLEDFLFLNQGINAECTNLFAEESYCVSPVGPINQYQGHPNYVEPSTTVSNIPFSNLPKATFTPPAISGLPTYLPKAKGTRRDCWVYADGTSLQYDTSWAPSISACKKIAQGWGISVDELQNWNPSLDPSSPDCVFSEEKSYCMGAYKKVYTYTPEPESEIAEPTTATTPTITSTTSQPTSTELPIRDGASENCKTYYAVIPPQTCEEVLNVNQLTIAEFYAMNPAIGPECHNLWPNYRYCVGI